MDVLLMEVHHIKKQVKMHMLKGRASTYRVWISLLTRPHDSGFFPPQTAAEMSLETWSERATEWRYNKTYNNLQ